MEAVVVHVELLHFSMAPFLLHSNVHEYVFSNTDIINTNTHKLGHQIIPLNCMRSMRSSSQTSTAAADKSPPSHYNKNHPIWFFWLEKGALNSVFSNLGHLNKSQILYCHNRASSLLTQQEKAYNKFTITLNIKCHSLPPLTFYPQFLISTIIQDKMHPVSAEYEPCTL